MSKETYIKTVAIIFLILGIIHLFRGILGLSSTIASWQMPVWASFLESGVFLALSYLGFSNRK